jgi:phosphoribosylformimino-5-aminoimidazole carboxamide ribotide isomerase
MRLLPVLDLQDGLVVRGVGGRRREYRPIVSRLTTSCRPLDVARAFRDHFGLAEIYLADLNAIAGAPAAVDTCAALKADGFRLRVDAGVRGVAEARPLALAGIEGIVAGLETLAGPTALEELCREFGGDCVHFSLDLKDGRPLGNTAGWQAADPWAIAEQAVRAGVGSVIVLDLARVGGNGGTGTESLCRRLAGAFPDLEVVAGGGVRGQDDLQRLKDCGVKAVLVASALHDGRLRREHLNNL